MNKIKIPKRTNKEKLLAVRVDNEELTAIKKFCATHKIRVSDFLRYSIKEVNSNLLKK